MNIGIIIVVVVTIAFILSIIFIGRITGLITKICWNIIFIVTRIELLRI